MDTFPVGVAKLFLDDKRVEVSCGGMTVYRSFSLEGERRITQLGFRLVEEFYHPITRVNIEMPPRANGYVECREYRVLSSSVDNGLQFTLSVSDEVIVSKKEVS